MVSVESHCNSQERYRNSAKRGRRCDSTARTSSRNIGNFCSLPLYKCAGDRELCNSSDDVISAVMLRSGASPSTAIAWQACPEEHARLVGEVHIGIE